MSIEVEKMTVTLEGNVSSYEAAMNRAIAITEKVESTIKGVSSKINALMGKLDVSAKLNVDAGSVDELKAKLQEADGIVDAEKSKLEMLVNRYNYVLSTLGKSSAGDAGKDVKAQTKVYNDAMANAVSIQKQLDAAQKGGTASASGGGLAGQLDSAVTKASALSLVITELVSKMTSLSGLARDVASSFGVAAASYSAVGGAAVGGGVGADTSASSSATAGAMTAVASSTGKASVFSALFSKNMASAKSHVQGTNFYSSSLSSKIGKIIQRFLIFKVVRSIFMGINEAFKLAGDNSEKTSKAFSQIKTATTNIQNAFAVAFLPLVRVAAPILEMISRKVVDLGNIVAQFMAALTGQTSYQKAEYAAEKWSSGVEKNAKKAKKAMNIMGFDELNILKKPEAASGGGGTATRTGIAKTESPIDPKIADFANRFREQLDKLRPVLDWFWDIIKKVFDYIINNKEKVVIAILAVLGAFLLFKTITTIVSLVTNPIFWIVVAIVAVVMAALWLKDNWQVVLDWLKQAWENIKIAFFNVVNFIWGLIVDFVNIILEFGRILTEGIWAVINFFVDMIVGFFKFLIDLSKTLWNFIIDAVKAGWNAIKNVLSVVGNWFKGIFESAWNGVKSAFANVKSFFTGVWTGIKDAFNSVVSWLGGVFGNAWQAIKDAFNGVGSWFGGLWNTIVGYFTNVGTAIGDAVGGAFKSAVNGIFWTIENIINGFIRLINGAIGIINKIPGVDIGEIGRISLPRLASGTVVEPNSPFTAVLGDNRQEQEIVSPMSTMVEAFKQAATSIQSNGGSGNGNVGSPIIIQFGSRVIREITVEEQRQAALQSGRRFVPA